MHLQKKIYKIISGMHLQKKKYHTCIFKYQIIHAFAIWNGFMLQNRSRYLSGTVLEHKIVPDSFKKKKFHYKLFKNKLHVKNYFIISFIN